MTSYESAYIQLNSIITFTINPRDTKRIYTTIIILLKLTCTTPPIPNQIIRQIQNLPPHQRLLLLLDPIVHPYFHLITIKTFLILYLKLTSPIFY